VNKAIVLLFLLFLPYSLAKAAERIVILGLFKDRAILEVNGSNFTLSAGESTPDGLISLISASSETAVLEIDGIARSYSLGAHIGSSFAPPAAGQSVTIVPDSQGMFWVNGHINRHHVRFIVDTGATLITLNRYEAARMGIDYRATGKQAVSLTASGEETVYIVNLESVYVGNIQLRNVAAAVHDSEYPRTILLGNSFLNQISLKRDGQVLQLMK